MKDVAILGAAALAAFFLFKSGGDSGGGSGGLGEELESIVETPAGLEINVPDYSDLLRDLLETPTKKAAEVYDSSNDHTFDIGDPSSFDVMTGRPLYDVLIPKIPTKTPLGFGGSWGTTASLLPDYKSSIAKKSSSVGSRASSRAKKGISSAVTSMSRAGSMN